MGRKQSNTAPYFPHYIERGKTIYILKNRFGNDGYAFWFQLLEILCSEEGHYYDCRGEDEWQYLVAYLGLNEQTATEMLNIVAKLHKIDAEMWENKIIWCENLIFNLKELYRKRGRQPQKPDFLLNNKVPTASNKHISVTDNKIVVAESTQSRVEKSKVYIPPIIPQGQVFIIFEQNYQKITDRITSRLNDLIDTYSEQWVVEALNEGVDRNHRNLKYVEKILENWRNDGHNNTKQIKSRIPTDGKYHQIEEIIGPVTFEDEMEGDDANAQSR